MGTETKPHSHQSQWRLYPSHHVTTTSAPIPTPSKICKANLCPWFMAYRDSSWPTQSEVG